MFAISKNNRQLTSFQRRGLAVSTSYSFRVRAVTLNDDGTEILGASTSEKIIETEGGQSGEFGFKSSTLSLIETTEDFIVTVTRSAEGGVTSIDYEILHSGIGDYAIQMNEDIVAADRGTLIFDDGVVERTVTLALKDDDLFEYPNERFGIVLSNPTGKATLNDNRTTLNVTVMDDGGAGLISFSSETMFVSES